MRIVIIGNSATAVGAVEAIRQHDQAAEIVMISEEPLLIYSRPLLSHYLAGEIDAARLGYRPADFYTKHNIRPILSTRVTAIHPEEHTVETDSGAQYPYDRLLICTGGVPIVPPVPGADMEGVFTFTRYDDATRIEAHIARNPVHHAVVVGGGMIGIKATDALMKRGLRVVMVELAPRILSMSLDKTASDLLANLLEREGVRVLTENTVVEISGEPGADGDVPHVTSVHLRDGRGLQCELLVFGIGVRPNADLAREAGLTVNRGIVVDAFMRTSAPDVYAAGDVAEAYD
ncbi:MAG: NAD(P)/FAD-dependent oxidoreductase, partial [Chloroflexi bacterium]|nr:NAD(P)/FAD-dependent oxidoreductase [Chloroflexota bacterium]